VSRRNLLLALAVAGAIQLAVPLWLIAGYERTLSHGSEWRFEVVPVDPADAFRGRYLALRFAAETTGLPTAAGIDWQSWVHVPLSEDPEGLAQLGPPRTEPPAEGAYLRVRVGQIQYTLEGPEAHIDLPFDRLYLPEGLAPAAEERLRESTAGHDEADGARAWAVVRIRDGRGVLEDLVIDGVSARQR
jgi:hypothetical protein